jgi:hypothetical protein
MNVKHIVEFESTLVSIKELKGIVSRLSIPDNALIKEADDSYDIVIEWTEVG